MTSTDMPFFDHMIELRRRIIICMASVVVCACGAYFFYDDMVWLVLNPLQPIQQLGGMVTVNSIYEGFFVKLKLSVMGGAVLSLPMMVFQVCRFILPALKPTEKKWVFLGLVGSSMLAMGSTYLAYVVVLPYVLLFLLDAQFIPSSIQVLLNYQQNVGYVVSFVVGSLFIFQSPIVLCVLLANNMVTRAFLLKNSRWFIVGIILASAVVTPPDVISQLAISLPLIGCYFGCIGLAKIAGWGVACSE